MIDFRYHLVSLISVFLALAIGLVLGATALKPLVVSGLQATANNQHRQIDQLIATGKLNRRQLAADEAFAQAAAPQLLAHLLQGQRVVLVTAPGASAGVTSGIAKALGEADATVTGQIQLQDRFFDPSPASQQVLSQLSQEFAPATVSLSGATPVAQAGRVLASAILTGAGLTQPVPGQVDTAGKSILNGLSAAGFVSVSSGDPAARATLAVVVIPASPPGTSDTSPASQHLVTLAQQLHSAGRGTVVAGTVTGSGPGSAIDVMRAGGRQGHMSSVDDADMAVGQIAVVQALYEQLHGVSGNYGINGSDGAGPSPAPTPSASLSSPAAGIKPERATASPSATRRH